MRVLCLHGAGTSADIFKLQTERFRALLPSDFEYAWVDGEIETDAAPGVEEVFPGPYLSFYDLCTTDQLADAHAQCKEVLEEEGPFDAVMGFSQGAALAASMIFRHQFERPHDPPLFRFALFLCASLPLSWDYQHGFDVTWLFASGRAMSVDFSEWQKYKKLGESHEGVVPDIDLNGVPSLARKSVAKAAADAAAAALMPGGERPMIKRFHHDHDTMRIGIPTAHVIGKEDGYREQSYALLKLCNPALAVSMEHPGDHEVPRTAEVTRAIADVIQRTITRSEFVL